MTRRKLPLKKALAIILCATAVVSGGSALAALYYAHIFQSQKADPAFVLQFLEQEGGLPSHYIEELLGLCVDHKVNIHEFCVKEAKRKLLNSPVIQSVKVKKSMPDACRVAYQLFKPVALLSDWENAALDHQGRMLPFHPFYSSEGLPVVAIGDVNHPEWGKKLKQDRVRLALKMLQSLPQQELIQLDVSRVDLPSFGQREVVITLQDAILRLNPDHWEKGWKNFLKMRPVLNTYPKCIVDLRTPRIALLDHKS